MRASLILLAACHLSAQGVPDAAGFDTAGGEAGDTSVDSMTCYGSGIFRACVMPTDPVTLDGNLDTDNDPRCMTAQQATGPDVCLVAGTDVMIKNVTATGTRPLVIVAVNTLDVATLLDVSTRRLGGGVGAGADAAGCPAGGDGMTLGGVGGGGAGGSFGGTGGNGGSGVNGAAAGAAAPAVAIGAVRGGCRGGNGANGQVAGPTGAHSGGAVYLIAGVSISNAGRIAAGGAGGAGGGIQAGGAGGGSGGLIGLDAPSITFGGTAIAAANGGGGGEGGGGGANGNAAQDALTTANPASGGSGGASAGGDGGDGSAGVTLLGRPAVNGSGSNGAGGGGGGAAGIIVVTAQPSGGTFSPPPQKL